MRRPNHALSTLINTAGLRPPQLVAAINKLLGEGYVSRSTVSEWLHAGRVPREPLPAIVVQLLSDSLGIPVKVHDLWPRPGLATTWNLPADHGMADIAKATNPTEALAADWIRFANHQAGCDRRNFYPLPDSGSPAAREGDDETQAAATGQWGRLAQRITNELAETPPGVATSRFAYRQVLALAEAVLEDPENYAIANALEAAISVAKQITCAEGKFGLAQRYGMTAALLSDASMLWRRVGGRETEDMVHESDGCS